MKMIDLFLQGEVTIQGVDGKFREKNTIAPSNDTYPPKG